MEIVDILMGYGPILFSGAVLGAVVTFIGPFIINKLKVNFNHQRVLDLYNEYRKNEVIFTKKHPALAQYFAEHGYNSCDCANCQWLQTKVDH